MRRLVIEPPARADIKSIRAYTRRVFGAGAQHKYGAAMQRAFELLCADPQRRGVQHREDLPRAPGFARAGARFLEEEVLLGGPCPPQPGLCNGASDGEYAVVYRITRTADLVQQRPATRR
jgi:plasmid stabilization system protein ParE